MIRKQIYLTEEMNRRLQEIANEKGVPQSEIIREGIEQYLVQKSDHEAAWNELLNEMKQSPVRDLKWNREEQYDARIRKLGGDHERTP
ncbi:ribbon-helix-helix domain-containing protein [Paenibacillus koleovorans]|uniref:ribbon-helix-helix domain-containing protein n=1 Tax=Paenibacillus koleovorans TaxID=121608 RepID=UPI0013E3F353|nr:CopG family transcriptional regulator [Paenibacillus koleovorans]